MGNLHEFTIRPQILLFPLTLQGSLLVSTHALPSQRLRSPAFINGSLGLCPVRGRVTAKERKNRMTSPSLFTN